MGDFEPMGGKTERALVEEEPVATADFVERACEPERTVTPLDVDETSGWPRLPRIASPRVTPRATPAEPRFVFVSGASVVLPPCPVPLTVRGTQALVSPGNSVRRWATPDVGTGPDAPAAETARPP